MIIIPSQNARATILQEQVELSMIICYTCAMPFMLPLRVHTALKETKATFYCPHGHEQAYCKSTAEILKEKYEKEIAEQKQEKSLLSDKLLDTINEKNKVTRELKRVHKGVCPCCNRSFLNLQKHMQTKHPDIAGKITVAPIHKKINSKTP